MSFCLTNHFVLENVAEVCKSQDVRDWLENDDTEVAYTTIGSSPYLAVAHKSEVVVIQLGQKAVGGVLKEKARVPYKRLMFLPLEGTVASMRWVRPSKSRSEPPLLAVGTDKGVLVLISYRAAVLHRQQLRTERVVSVKEKTKGKPCGEDLLVLTAPNHLFHFDTTHLSRLLDPRYLEPANDNRGTPAFHAQATTVPLFSVFPAFSRDGLPCTIHQLKPAAKTPGTMLNDFVPVGKIRSAPLDVYNSIPKQWIVSGGQQPSMAAYNMVTETASAADLAKGAAKKVTTAALSLVSSWWGGHGEAASKAPQLPAAARVHPSHVFNDAGRTVQRVTIDSVGRYLSTSDTLGRVTIMDTAMFVTVKMLKGYRDASVVWLNGKSPERAVGTFFVYLPRRGLVEAWKVSKPARLAAFKIGLNCRLLTPCPTKPCACLVLHPDGRLSTLCLEHEEDRKKGETGAGAMTQSAQLKLWREKAATPGVDEETLLTVLEGVRPAVDLLECVVTLSDSLGLQVWRCVTTAAMGQLEKQGVNLEHALQESQKTTASNDTLSASMDGCDDIDACLRRSPVSEADRLMSPDSPALSEADVYRYLIHRLSALNACVMLVARPSAKRRKAELVAIQQAWTQAMQSIVFDEPAVPPLGSLFSLGPRGDDEQADEEALSRRDLSPSKFLAHFDLIKQAIVLHAATPDLADFICYPLLDSAPDTVARAAQILSLSNRVLLELLLLWGRKYRDVTSAVPIEVLARLVTTPIVESLPSKLPAWLLSLRSKNVLHHAGLLLIAARKKVVESGEDLHKVPALDTALKHIACFLQLKQLLPSVAWIEATPLSFITGLSPAALVAAAYATSELPEKTREYLEERHCVEAFHFHSALLLHFVYMRRTWREWKYKDLCVTEDWLQLTSEVAHGAAEDESSDSLAAAIVGHLNSCGSLQCPAAYWCAAAAAAPLASLVGIARLRKCAPAVACGEVQKAAADVRSHCEFAAGLVQILAGSVDAMLSSAAGPSAEEDEGYHRTKAYEWWLSATGCDVMITTLHHEIMHAASLSTDQLGSLLAFLSFSLREDVRGLGPMADGSSFPWTKLFPPAALKFTILNNAARDPPSPAGSQHPRDLAAKRQGFTAEVTRSVDNADDSLAVGLDLSRVLQLPDTHHVLLEVARRLHVEGADARVSDLLESHPGVPNAQYLAVLINVARLRLRHILSSPLAGGSTQKRSERSLNLVSGMPLELVNWIGDIEVSEKDDAAVAQWMTTVPMATVCQRTKTLLFRTLQLAKTDLREDRGVLDKLQKALDFIAYLLKNV